MGTPQFAIPSFTALLEDARFEVVGVVTQPDKKVGRKQVLTPPPVKVLAQKYDIPCFQPQKASSDEFVEKVKNLDIDMIFVVAYGQILSQEFLDIPKYGCINLHASLLPKFRGASPLQAVILAGKEKTGISYMRIEKQLDAGPVIKQYEIDLKDQNIVELHDELAKLGGETVGNILFEYAEGKLDEAIQNHKNATFCKMIQRKDGQVFPQNEDAEEIIKKYKAFFVWPGIYVLWGELRIKLFDIVLTNEKSYDSGLLEIQKEEVYLHTKSCKLRIKSLQLEGKKRVSAKEWICSHENKIIKI